MLVLQLWSRICDASRKEFEKIYVRLGVTLQERGESFYNPFLKVRRCLMSLNHGWPSSALSRLSRLAVSRTSTP